jgi:UDP-N-acetylmuramyl pentapeptide synthase
MNEDIFIQKCNFWSYKNWDKGLLTEYWEKAGLSVGNILQNREKLKKVTTSIGITGSVGKSTLSKMLYEMITSRGDTCYVTKINDNWLPQLPLASLSALQIKNRFSIFECGLATKGDLELIASFIPFDYIIFCEFIDDGINDIPNEKLKIISGTPPIKIISHINNKKFLKERGLDATFYGEYRTGSDLEYKVLSMEMEKTIIKLSDKKGERTTVTLPDFGFHLGSAAAGSFTCYCEIINYLGGNMDLSGYKNPSQRLERFKMGDIEFIIDTANLNEKSLKNAIRSFLTIKYNGHKDAIIQAPKVYSKIIKYELEKTEHNLNSIHLVGDLDKDLLHFNNIHYYKDLQSLARSLDLAIFEKHLVLLRGPTSKGVNLSNIIKNYDGSSQETSPAELLYYK